MTNIMDPRKGEFHLYNDHNHHCCHQPCVYNGGDSGGRVVVGVVEGIEECVAVVPSYSFPSSTVSFVLGFLGIFINVTVSLVTTDSSVYDLTIASASVSDKAWTSKSSNYDSSITKSDDICVGSNAYKFNDN